MGKKTNPGEQSPYLNARNEWNERYGSYIKQTRNWQLATFFSLAIAVGSVAGVAILASQQKVVPYIVETNAFGEVIRTNPADQAHSPNEKEMKAALRNWIIGARTVYVDMRAEKAIVDATYAMTTPDSAAYQQLAAYHRDNDPYHRSVNETVEVQVSAVVPVTNKSWRVEWTETTKQRSGKVLDTKSWEGTFTVMLAPPVSAETIMINPLGIYVQEFAWTPRI